MKIITYTFQSLFILFLCISCTQNHNKLPIDFDYVNEFSAQKADSISYILENFNPSHLVGKDKADYWYLLTKIHEYQKRSLVNDSLINFSVQYYQENVSPQLGNAYRLAGVQAYVPTTPYEKSEELLTKSLNIGEENNDTTHIINTCFSLADIYFFEQNHAKAVSLLKKTEQLGNKYNKIISNYIIACAYLLLNDQDSCFFHFEKAIHLVKHEEHTDKKSLLRNYADCLNFFHKSKQAIEVLDSLNIKYPFEEFNEKMALISYANAWLNLKQPDSAKVYLDHINEAIKNVSPQNPQYYYQSMYSIFRAIYRNQLGLPAEMITFAQHADRSKRSNEYSIARDKERIFQQNKLVKDKNRIEIEKAKQLQIYLYFIIVLLSIVVVLVVIYQRRLLHKERLIQKAKEHLQQYILKLRENENTITKNQQNIHLLISQLGENAALQEEQHEIEEISRSNNLLQEQNTLLKDEIEKYSKMIQDKSIKNKTFEKLNEQNQILQEREKFLTEQLINNNVALKKLKNSPKFLTEEEWYEVTNTINIFFNHFTTRLHVDYPKLTTEDIKYCSLIKLHLSTSNIAIIMSVSPTSVTKRKHRIKEKIDSGDQELFVGKSLDSFLWNY